MYCQSCGTEIQHGLNYCNRCGAQVVSLAAAQDERVVYAPADVSGPLRWLAATICLTMILGLVVLFTAMVVAVNFVVDALYALIDPRPKAV